MIVTEHPVDEAVRNERKQRFFLLLSGPETTPGTHMGQNKNTPPAFCVKVRNYNLDKCPGSVQEVSRRGFDDDIIVLDLPMRANGVPGLQAPQ